LSKTAAPGFLAGIAQDQAALRESRDGVGERPTLPIAEARANRFDGGWQSYAPPAPQTPGVTVIDDMGLDTLSGFIDWTPFFHAWEMRGRFPEILDHAEKGAPARELFENAQKMLARIVEEGWFAPKGVVGLWPANAGSDDIVLWTGEDRSEEMARLPQLRQQGKKSGDKPNLSLADFVAPAGIPDWIGGFAVTAGAEVHALSDRFKAEGNDYDAIMVQALGDRLAEAFAEALHARVRRSLWGYAADEDLDNEALIRERYRGIRPAPGYPANPDHTEKRTLFRLLDATKNTGLELTESCAMWPAASVAGLYFAHPDSAYFGIGRIGPDQAADYALRKGMDLAEVERWLAPVLGYAPGRTPAGRRSA
jgi:5-methyltetrahydrofolate--homocysteine methyltransferase